MSAMPPSKKAEARAANTSNIIAAAERVFAEKGFSGATTQEIAQLANLPKSNLHYYFATKKDLYLRVLEDVLEVWIKDAEYFDTHDDPELALSTYITRKMEHSFTRPYASKVWAMETIGGGRMFDSKLRAILVKWNKKKVDQLKTWIDQGRMNPVDPQYFMFSIWATTQHYADFEYQIRVLNKGRALTAKQRQAAIDSVIETLLRGVMPH